MMTRYKSKMKNIKKIKITRKNWKMREKLKKYN